VVALKQLSTSSSVATLIRKQERRGGIETYSSVASQAAARREAGTPWWH